MKLPEIEITNVGAWKSPDGESGSRARFVAKYELECIVSDGGVSMVNLMNVERRRDMLLFAKPGQIRSSSFPYETKFLYFELEDDGHFKEVLSRIPAFTPPSAKVAELFNRVFEHFKRNKMLATCALIELLLTLSVPGSEGKTESVIRGQREIFSAVLFMKNNLSKRLSVEEMAKAAGYSASHFAARFKELMHCTPYEYFNRMRVVEAKRLLVSDGLSVAEVAERLGFASAAHFCALFLCRVGCTPRQFTKVGTVSGYEGG